MKRRWDPIAEEWEVYEADPAPAGFCVCCKAVPGDLTHSGKNGHPRCFFCRINCGIQHSGYRPECKSPARRP